MFHNVVTPSTYGPMIINRFDTVVGYNISAAGAWMDGELRLLRHIVAWAHEQGRKVYFVDGGANVGMHSLAVASLRLPHLCCYALEAQRAAFYQLCGTLALNSLSEVIALHRVLSDRSGERVVVPRYDPGQAANFGAFSLAQREGSPTGGAEFGGRLTGQAEQVATVTLDDLLGDVLAEDATVIKLDIEGMEPQALRGAKATLTRTQPVFFVEYAQCSKEDVLHALRDAFGPVLPYRVFDMPEKNLLLLPPWCADLVVEMSPGV